MFMEYPTRMQGVNARPNEVAPAPQREEVKMAFRASEAEVSPAGSLAKLFNAAVEGSYSLASRLADGAENNPEVLLGRLSFLERVAR